MLMVHIVSAIIGIIGAYLWAFSFFRKKLGLVGIGIRLTFIGLFFLTLSGIVLFARNPQLFLESGKFLPNMTIMLVLIVVELSFFKIKDEAGRKTNRIISLFSWSWIFLAAVLDPPFPYWYFMAAYVLLLILIIQVTKYIRGAIL